jgi:hypothetical protein
MPKRKRKYKTDTIDIASLALEPISSKDRKSKPGKISRKKARERGLSQDMISGIIEKIKDI